MGMYTELNIGVAFKEDTPENIIDILKYMLNYENDEPETTDHPLFKTPRWSFMLRCDSYYFDGHTDSSMIYNDISNQWYLNVRSNLKNYDGEIELFLHFIQPYLETTDFLGYMRYEEYDDPTLIYNTGKSIVFGRIDDRCMQCAELNENYLKRYVLKGE